MAEYKKKHVKKSRKAIKNSVEEIAMKPKSRPKREKGTSVKETAPVKTSAPPKIKVIRGNKNKIRKKRFIFGFTAILIVCLIVAFTLFLPTCIYDFFANKISLIGSGSGYPVSLSGGSIIDVVPSDGFYSIVSSTNLEGYNNNGKLIFSYQHGYERPCLETSSTRLILFSQGQKDYAVYNFRKNLITAETDNNILSAAVAENGSYALATQSDSYTSEVAVYNSKNEVIFKWFCADYIINDVVFSPNGKNIAVSAFNAVDGHFISKLYILNFESATPVKTFTFENDFITALESVSRKSFCAVFSGHTNFFNWKKYENTEFSSDKSVAFVRTATSNSIIVTGREGNKSDNTITVFDSAGAQKYSFDFTYEITDIAVLGKYIYILSDRQIYFYNIKGDLLNIQDCSFGIGRIVPIKHHRVAALTDTTVSKITIE